jgi:transcriptional regulator GlxA family with amidase domain
VEASGIPQPYSVRVCGLAKTVKAGAFNIQVSHGLSDIAGAQTVVLPGIADPSRPIPAKVLAAVREAAARGARVASICTGAFVLAAAGLLDGRRATTHWRAAELLARRYPAIHVDPDVLYVDNGQILTSAGAASGLDLCLHMIRCDYGPAVAAQAARLSVMPLEREGGQAQFIVHEPPESSDNLAPLLQWLSQNLHRRLDVKEVASQAILTPRTLSRRFRQQVGTTLLQWILDARVRRAQELLETTGLSIEQVAEQTGFGSSVTLRERFARAVGTTPTAYRRALGHCARDAAASWTSELGNAALAQPPAAVLGPRRPGRGGVDRLATRNFG